SAATTSACGTGAPSSSTGTTLTSAIRSSTQSPGCRAFAWKPGRSRRSSSQTAKGSLLWSPASSPRAPACRPRLPRPASASSSSARPRSRCRGPPANLSSHRRKLATMIRSGGARDVPFLRDMLRHAFYWRTPVGDEEPPLTRYVNGWGRPGDRSLIVFDEFVPVGAAWYRLFTHEDAGFGFIDEQTPELAIA